MMLDGSLNRSLSVTSQSFVEGDDIGRYGKAPKDESLDQVVESITDSAIQACENS